MTRRAMRTAATNLARRRGYTLAESLIASVVLAAAVVGISTTLSASYQQSTIRGNTNTALILAQQLMEEIAGKPLDLAASATNLPGWSGGQTDRSLYDTVDDYHGYTDTSGSIETADGTTLDMGDGGSYTRTVSITENAMPTGLTGTASDFVLITVTVSMPHGQSTSIS